LPRALQKAVSGAAELLRGNFLILMVTWVLMRMALRTALPYEALFIRALGADETVIGLMMSAYQAVLCLSIIPGSYIADRWGRKHITAVMTTGLGLSYLFYCFAPSWHLILAGMLVAAVCRVYGPALSAITADSIPPGRRGMGYSMTRVLPDALALASPLIGAFLIEEFGLVDGLRIAYAAVVVVFLVCALLRLLFLKETVKPSRPGGGIRGVYAEAVRDLVITVREAPRPLKALLFAPLLIIPLTNGLWTFIPLFVIDFSGLTEAEWGLISTVRVAVGLSTGLILGGLVDRLNRKNVLVASYLARSVLMGLLVFSRGFVQILIIMVFFEFLVGLSFPAISSLLADLTPRQMRGRVLGARMLLVNIVSIPMPTLVGFLYQYVSPRLPFFAACALSAASALALALAAEEPLEKEA